MYEVPHSFLFLGLKEKSNTHKNYSFLSLEFELDVHI